MKITVGGVCFDPNEANSFQHHAHHLVRKTAQLVEKWNGHQPVFELTTSGSTGEPKSVIHHRKYLEWVAGETHRVMQLGGEEKVCCCLPLDKAGGFMMLVRSLVFDWDIEILEPVANPADVWTLQPTFISMVPYQLEQILAMPLGSRKLDEIPHILLGGTSLPTSCIQYLSDRLSPGYIGYGMTETAGHIALKTIGTDYETEPYVPFHGVQFSLQDEFVTIDIPHFTLRWVTRDIGLVEQGNLFLTGRSEELLNSAGLKITATALESHLGQFFKGKVGSTPFVVFGIPDKKFGQVIGVVFEGSKPDAADLEACKEYLTRMMDRRLIPNHWFAMEKIPRVNMKPDRRRLSQIFGAGAE